MDQSQYSNWPSRSALLRKASRGFTIIEVLVASLILTIGVLSAAALIGSVVGGTSRSEYMNQAATIASEKLEDLNRWPASINPIAGDVGDPHVVVTNGTSAGSLTSDLVQDVTANGSTEAVNYYDEVYFNPAQGALDEVVSSLNGSGNVQYTNISHPATGMISDPGGSNPPAPTSAPPATSGAIAFKRRWIIELNQPVTGVRRITVLVTCTNGFVQPPVSFQMSLVRP
jgi:prepilin-type N-terminal cleavage/methylation domain-containing protein